MTADCRRERGGKMDAYLGEEPIIDLGGTPFDGFTAADWAAEYIERYGGIDDHHHRAWVMDQVMRILKGTPVHVRQAMWEREDAEATTSEYRFVTGHPTQKYLDWAGRMFDDGGYDQGTAP